MNHVVEEVATDTKWIKQTTADQRCVGCDMSLAGAQVIGLAIAWHPFWARVTDGEPTLRLTVGCGWCLFVHGVEVSPTRAAA